MGTCPGFTLGGAGRSESAPREGAGAAGAHRGTGPASLQTDVEVQQSTRVWLHFATVPLTSASLICALWTWNCMSGQGEGTASH